jgi:hypothetical protein
LLLILFVDVQTAQEFRCGVKRDMTQYKKLREDKKFNFWNRRFIVTAHLHHTHLVLDADYSMTNAIDVAFFKEMQPFMYTVLQEHLKTTKWKSLVSPFEATRDAQSIYPELMKHALSSTSAQLSGDTLLQ